MWTTVDKIKIFANKQLYYCVSVLLLYSWAWGEDFHTKFVPHPDERIPHLNWDSSSETQEPTIQVKEVPHQKPTFYVTLKGSFKEKGTTLLYNSQTIELGPKGEFSIDVDVSSDHEKVSLVAVDDDGTIKKGRADILFPDWKRFLADRGKKPTKRFSIIPALGFTMVNYSQTSVETISELLVTPKISGQYILSPYWSLDANIFYTALPLSKSPSSDQIQFFGVNVRAGYLIKAFSNNSWALRISGGYYFNTSFSNSQSYGYSSVNGPQFFPTLTKLLPRDQAAWLYLKYSPVFNGLSLLSLNNTEMGGGIGYSFTPLKNNAVISATFDAVILQLQVVGVSVQCDSYTLGASYRF